MFSTVSRSAAPARGTLLVTGGDSRYFPLLRDCLQSMPRHAGWTTGVLDCGLAPGEAAWCRSMGARLVVPGDDVAFGPGLTTGPSFRAMTARPYLRDYFPGFDTYVWLDADVWVQHPAALDLLIGAAAAGDIAAVPELHRSYANLRDGRDDFEAANGRAYAEAFGAETAHRLIRRPLVNAGVFALNAASPAWALWAQALARAAQRSLNMIDQIALNAAIYDGGLREVRLPPVCNWIAHLATPAWHVDHACFVEPDPPFETIGILHLTLATKWDASARVPLVGSAAARGATVDMSLRLPPGGEAGHSAASFG